MSPIERAVDTRTFLEEIRKRPAMWLGEKSATRLWLFLDGFMLAETVHDVLIPRLEDARFGLFETWVQNRISGHEDRSSFWEAIHRAESDEAAFDLWFAWWDEFRHEQAEHAETESHD